MELLTPTFPIFAVRERREIVLGHSHEFVASPVTRNLDPMVFEQLEAREKPKGRERLG
jgi:hypothetical protein